MSTVPGLAGRVAPHLRRVLIVVMIIAAAIALGKGLISFETTRLFYVTTGHAALFTTIIVTQLALFAAFGLLTVLVVGGSLWWFFRHRPAWHPDYHTQLYRWQFMRLERPLRGPLTVLVVGLLAYRAGAAAAGQWQTALAWAYARPWGVVDSHFHRDAAFFVATVPFATLVVAAVSTAFTTAIAAVLVVAFPYGALLPGKGRPRVARSLAAFITVDSTPGPDYGHFTVLEPPAGASVPSPAQIQNDVESSTRISEALTLQRGGNSTVILGNLLCIPLGGRMLYVEPVYTRAAGGGSFPVLRHVIAAYGDSAPSFEATLPAALSKALGSGGRG